MSAPAEHIADQALTAIVTALAAIRKGATYHYTPKRVVRRLDAPLDEDYDESVGSVIYVLSAMDRESRPRVSTMSAQGKVPFILTLIQEWNFDRSAFNPPTPDEVTVVHRMERDVEIALCGTRSSRTLGDIVINVTLTDWNRDQIAQKKDGWLMTRRAGEAEYRYTTGAP